MSEQVEQEIREVNALIRQIESTLGQHPGSLALRSNLRSLRKMREKLEAKAASPEELAP